MACKQGIRRDIETAKVYYKQQREPDPFRDHWKALVARVGDAPDGFYQLSLPEQTYFAVTILVGDVYNGGIHQYFFNSSGDFYLEAMLGLSELGAFRCHALLLAARKKLFNCEVPPSDTSERRAIIFEASTDLDLINKEFWSDPDKLDEKLRSYAIQHQLV